MVDSRSSSYSFALYSSLHNIFHDIANLIPFCIHVLYIFLILTTNLAVDVCQCAQFDQFLPARSHFESKRSENFVRIAKFPYAAFGPLFAFHCPLFLRETMI